MRVCKKCNFDKPVEEFHITNKDTGARRHVCKSCRAEQVETWTLENLEKVRASKAKWAKENKCKIKTYRNYYAKTKRGFIGSTYTNMDSRVKGRNKPWLYKGLEICSREDFIEWTTSDRMFNNLFDVWERSGYDYKLTPSIDRLNSTKGYTFDNMGWITHSENSQRGAFSRWGLGD